MNHHFVVSDRYRGVAARRLLRFAAGALLPVASATATTTWVPYGSASLNYDSNLYRVSSKSSTTPVQEDYFLLSTLGLNATYLTGDQRLRFKAEGRKAVYDRTSTLDHTEYLFGGGLDFTVIRALTGSLDYDQGRSLAAYENLNTTQLTITRSSNLGSELNYRVADQWSTGLNYHRNESRTPLPGNPDFKLLGNEVNGQLQYIGSERTAIGVTGGYGFGHYVGGSGTGTNFHYYTAAATANYEATGLSRFLLKVGMTSRSDDVSGSTGPAFSGEVSYFRKLTGKTSAGLTFSRNLESYSIGNSAKVQDTGRVFAIWEASDKVKLTIATSQSYLKLLTKDPTDILNRGRKDRIRISNLEISYDPLRWLNLLASGGYQTQTSNFSSNSFKAATAALQVQLRFE